jgi:hypothetical protein
MGLPLVSEEFMAFLAVNDVAVSRGLDSPRSTRAGFFDYPVEVGHGQIQFTVALKGGWGGLQD